MVYGDGSPIGWVAPKHNISGEALCFTTGFIVLTRAAPIPVSTFGTLLLWRIYFCNLNYKQQTKPRTMDTVTISNAIHLLRSLDKISALTAIGVMETLELCKSVYLPESPMGRGVKLSRSALLKFCKHIETHKDDKLLAPCVGAKDWTQIKNGFVALSGTPYDDQAEQHTVAFLKLENVILSVVKVVGKMELTEDMIVEMEKCSPEFINNKCRQRAYAEQYERIVELIGVGPAESVIDHIKAIHKIGLGN
jgi:hypothetical protein